MPPTAPGRQSPAEADGCSTLNGRLDGCSQFSKGCEIRGLPGKSRTRAIRELIPFNYWADKAAQASLALLIRPRRRGLASSEGAVPGWLLWHSPGLGNAAAGRARPPR